MMKTRLKDLRISAGLTQKEVANAFGGTFVGHGDLHGIARPMGADGNASLSPFVRSVPDRIFHKGLEDEGGNHAVDVLLHIHGDL